MPEATKSEILKAFAELKNRDRLKTLQQNALKAAQRYSWHGRASRYSIEDQMPIRHY